MGIERHLVSFVRQALKQPRWRWSGTPCTLVRMWSPPRLQSWGDLERQPMSFAAGVCVPVVPVVLMG